MAKDSCKRVVKFFGDLWSKDEALEFQAYQRTRSLSLLQKLQERYLHIVRPIAAEIYHRNEWRYEYNDLFDEGALGLAVAITAYDFNKNPSFIGFATSRIKIAIYDFLSKETKIPKTQRRAYNLYEKARHLIFTTTGDSHPSENEIEGVVREILYGGSKLRRLIPRAVREAMNLGSKKPFQVYLEQLKMDPIETDENELLHRLFGESDEIVSEETKIESTDSTCVVPEPPIKGALPSYEDVFQNVIEHQDIFAALLNPLTDLERQVALSHYQLGLPVHQIARRIDLSESRTRVLRGGVIAKLNREIRKIYNFDSR